MFWRIIDGLMALMFFVAAIFAIFGDFELDNNDLTFWVALALFSIWKRKALEG